MGLMRPLVMDFPQDSVALQQKYEFMFGKDLLVAPVVTQETHRTCVYLPNTAHGWFDFWTGEHFFGGRAVEADASLDKIPLFVAAGSILPLGPKEQYVSEKPADPIELRVCTGKEVERQQV